MRMADLGHARVAVWGYGREGRAALAVLRRRFPQKALTLFCSDEEAQSFARHPSEGWDPALRHPRQELDSGFRRNDELCVITPPPSVDVLKRFDIVIKSPGISPYKSPVPDAMAAGVKFTSGTALWFAENPTARVIGVTGTKGKSTTSAMIAHLARGLDVRTALAGNIGMPLLDLLGQEAALWVVELSSFQTGDAGPLDVGVITNLYEEHLDWHGTRERYAADKLKIVDVARTLVVNAEQPELLARTAPHTHRATFGDAAGWHIRDGAIWRGNEPVLPLVQIPLSGEHNASNVCAALAAIECAGLDSFAAARYVASFIPLPHRLQSLGMRDGIEYINDSISTTPYATVEALRSLDGRAVSVIVGGFDRGVDWSGFVEYVAAHPPHTIIATGANGARIAESLGGVRGFELTQAATMAEAVSRARAQAPAGSVILLSPGAPSFDQFRDYAERGREFVRLAGFDPAAMAQIEGLGIA
ncbi:MAG TPA: UDP-N-acetylmuramoyl-L-alanine--D-glutamate ligase [Rudaea sp.]|nr:UDP-N-acetylmuramoyl-L-alanine--D-glutamate ligase [Rudaea sp.]